MRRSALFRGIVLSSIVMLFISAISFSQVNIDPTRITIGNANDIKDAMLANFSRQGRGEKPKFTLKIGEESSKEIILSNVIESERAGNTTIMGHIDGKPEASIFLSFDKDQTVFGKLIDKRAMTVIAFEADDEGNLQSYEEDIHKVLCISYDKYYAAGEEEIVREAKGIDDSPSADKLQSHPTATAVVYLDFDGAQIEGTFWNEGELVDAAAANFSSNKIKDIWKYISEDFLPFNVNVTTDESVFNAAPRRTRMQVIFTPTKAWYGAAGGVAYINSFRWNRDEPCWVFNQGTKSAAEAGSHEIGHTLGLRHDGRTNPEEEYFSGHGSWGPIMGGTYGRPIVQWSKGEYNNPSRAEQDDIAIIASGDYGFTYREDDHENNINGATALIIQSNNEVIGDENDGLIEKDTDKDVFSFTTSGGIIDLDFSPAAFQPNLKIGVRLLNSSGNELGTYSSNGLGTSLNENLTQGTYYLEVDGIGDGDPRTNGYSDYGSLGYYSISGTIPFSQNIDCNGTVNGSASIDNCGICSGGNTGVEPNSNCTQDCDGIWGGTAFLDNCNECVGGNTGLATCSQEPYRSGDPHSIPGIIESEEYDEGGAGIAYNDLDEGNNGPITFRKDDVDVQNNDNGGINIGWVNSGEWLEYTVDVQTTGSYSFEFRMASINNDKTLQVSLDGNNASFIVDVMNTGGWQEYELVKIEGISLVKGVQVMRIESLNGGVNLDHLTTVFIGVEDCNGVANGNASIDNCGVCSGGNTGIEINSSCVQDCNGDWDGTAELDNCGVCTGGKTNKFECVDLENGTYTFSPITSETCVYVANELRQQACDEDNIAQIWSITKRGDFYSFENYEKTQTLSYSSTENSTEQIFNGQFSNTDEQLYRIEKNPLGEMIISPKSNLNKVFELAGDSESDNGIIVFGDREIDQNQEFVFNLRTVILDCNGDWGGEAKMDVCEVCSGGNTNIDICLQAPFNFEPQIIPGIIEAEYYDYGAEGDAYHDTDINNRGGRFREDGVDLSGIDDPATDFMIGWTQVGEWLEYTVDVEESSVYEIIYHISSRPGNGKMHIEVGGNSYGDLEIIESTGEWNIIEDRYSLVNIPLEEGVQVLRFVIEEPGFNLGGITFRPAEITGTNDLISDENTLDIYPNPVEDYLTIDNEFSEDWIIYNSLGEKMATGSENSINLSDYTSGIYTLRIGGKAVQIIKK